METRFACLFCCSAFIANATASPAADAAAADDDDDDADLSTLPGDAADTGASQQSNQQLAASASRLISRYVLAKLLGASPAKLTQAVPGLQYLQPGDVSLDSLPQLPGVLPLPGLLHPRHAYDDDQVK